MDKYNVITCNNPYEKIYGSDDIKISKIIEKALVENDDLFWINLDGAKENSDLQMCMDKMPYRVLNSGIAEQNMIGISAGIALMGGKVICMSYGPFVVMRAIEQIYMDVAYNNVPVCIVLTGTGLSGGEGPTHNVVHDFAMLRSIPGMIIESPADPLEVKWAIEAYLSNPVPMYIRCGKANMPLIHKDKPSEYKIGKAELLNDGKGITVFATGSMVCPSFQAVTELEKQGVKVRLVEIHTIKPFDRDIVEIASKDSTDFIVVEEHSVVGGLASVVADILSEREKGVRVHRIGIPDEFAPDGSDMLLYEYYGLTASRIRELILTIIGGKQ